MDIKEIEQNIDKYTHKLAEAKKDLSSQLMGAIVRICVEYGDKGLPKEEVVSVANWARDEYIIQASED